MQRSIFSPAIARVLALAALFAVDGSHSARATTYTWNGVNASINDNWSNPGNWTTGVPVSSTDTDLVFAGQANGYGSSNENIADPFTLDSLTFNSGAPAYTLSGGALTFVAVSSSRDAIDQNSTSLETINNNVNLNPTGYIVRSFGVNGGGLTLTGVFDATNLILAETGTGVLTLSNTADLMGALITNAGSVVLANAGSVQGNLGVQNNGRVRITSTSTLAGNLTLTNGADTLSAASGTTLTLAGALQTNSADFVFGEAGQTGVILAAGSSFDNFGRTAPAVAINGGTLRAGGTALPSLLAAATGTTIASGATLDLNGYSATVSVLSGAGTLATGSTAGAVVTVNSGSFSGTITGFGGLTKASAGTLTLSGASTYTGGTTIQAGSLVVANDANLGAASGGVTILGAGTLTFTDANVSTGRTFNLSAATLAPASGGTLTFAGATIYGGTLGAGNEVFTDGTSLNSVAGTTGSAWSQTGGTVTFNGVTLNNAAAFTQAAGAVTNSTGSLTTAAASTVAISGTVNVAGASLGGGVTINNGGQLNESGRRDAALPRRRPWDGHQQRRTAQRGERLDH